MLGLFRKNAKSVDSDAATSPVLPESSDPSMLERMRESLSRSRTHLSEGISRVFLGQKTLNQDLLEELESLLLMADLGLETTDKLIERVKSRLSRTALKDATEVKLTLREALAELLHKAQSTPLMQAEHAPFVLMMVGVNGVGKTTSIGKLAKQFQTQGQRVMLAAGDTFRAAAVEQLKVWGERNAIPVIAQGEGADSASVAFDACESAKARATDVLIIDTAGRLHTQNHLMNELAKVKRVIQKVIPHAPHEIWLVLDATTGQNALNQAREFKKMVEVTGLVLTKLDGTAKGGIVFSIADQLGLPIRYIGIGESIEDLRAFEADLFIEAILGHD
jgi:fused signal recognition particle receptor